MYKNTCIEILNVHSLHPNGYELTPLSDLQLDKNNTGRFSFLKSVCDEQLNCAHQIKKQLLLMILQYSREAYL